MHAGALGYVYLIATLILFTTGWESVLAGGVRHRQVYLFCGLAALFSFSHFPFTGLTIRGTAFILLLFVTYDLLRLKTGLERAVVVSTGVFLAAAGHLTGEWAEVTPSMVLTTPEIDFSLVLAGILGLCLRNPDYQLPVMTISLLLLDLINIVELPVYAEREWAGRAFWDEWWMTLWTARILSVVTILHIGLWRVIRGKWRIPRERGAR
ncbi:hypothetical protein [Gorillibacterium timonense]|uniref:hypothetical protein n=1 Tax=Gorillibacterium timonense TaxID=1689269 RepID=UPI00071D1A47|nr:hypothetical protein [Gorillibacterium timonense]